MLRAYFEFDGDTKKVARLLGYTPGTMHTYFTRIYEKLDLPTERGKSSYRSNNVKVIKFIYENKDWLFA